MTPIFLMDELKKFIEEKTADIKLPVKVRTGHDEEKERQALVYQMGLPNAEDTQQKVPYILLKFLTGVDDKEDGEPDESTCKIRIIFATYSKDGQEGAIQTLNLMLRVRSELEKAGIIDRRFVLQKPLEYIMYQDVTPPYYMGEMITNWSIPTITREVEELWQ